MKISPKGHYVLIKPDPVEEASEGGIILNVDYKRELAATTTGTVVAIGPTAWMAYDFDKPAWKPWAEVGERVFFVRHVGKLITDPDTGEEYFLMADENILCGIGEDNG